MRPENVADRRVVECLISHSARREEAEAKARRRAVDAQKVKKPERSEKKVVQFLASFGWADGD